MILWLNLWPKFANTVLTGCGATSFFSFNKIFFDLISCGLYYFILGIKKLIFQTYSITRVLTHDACFTINTLPRTTVSSYPCCQLHWIIHAWWMCWIWKKTRNCAQISLVRIQNITRYERNTFNVKSVLYKTRNKFICGRWNKF